MASEQALLLEFFKRIWREEKGFVYIALKDPGLPKDNPNFWKREFFEWPVDEISIVQTVIAKRASHDVYFAPSIFRERSSKKEAVLGSFCYWVEFDGALPAEFEDLPNPNIVVQTSTETHQHIYWCVDQLVPIDKLEAVNRALTYKLGADASGWDANQVLRPPGTLNHKKQLQASLVHFDDRYISSVAFSEISAKNLPPKLDLVGPLPPVEEVVSKYTFLPNVWELFTKGVSTDRSAGLMSLGYYLAEMNLTNAEMLVLLLHADNRWGKFSRRSDQMQRLTEVVTRARLKYPYKTGDEKSELIVIGNETLLSIETEVEWLWEDIFYRTGMLLLTGHAGVGKSQFSLDLATHLILKEDFLDRKVSFVGKVLFVSLEMGDLELKNIRKLQSSTYTTEQRALLEENLKFIPQGFPTYYNRDEEKFKLENLLEQEQIDLVIFDSLSAMTEQELSKEADAKNLMDWSDRLRNKLGKSLIIIHHNRKAQVGNKRPKELSDIYGSQYFGARSTSVMTLWEEKRNGAIEASVLKVRLAPKPKPSYLVRKDDLTYTLLDKKLIITDEIEEEYIELPETTNIFNEEKGWDF